MTELSLELLESRVFILVSEEDAKLASQPPRPLLTRSGLTTEKTRQAGPTRSDRNCRQLQSIAVYVGCVTKRKMICCKSSQYSSFSRSVINACVLASLAGLLGGHMDLEKQ